MALWKRTESNDDSALVPPVGVELTDPRIIGVVAAGAGIGGVARLLLTQYVASRLGSGSAFYATLFINISGSFLIGCVLETVQLRLGVNPLWRYFLATGILGGYTTFSTFSYEALNMFSAALNWSAVGYIVASVALGIVGSLLGVMAARVVLH